MMRSSQTSKDLFEEETKNPLTPEEIIELQKEMMKIKHNERVERRRQLSKEIYNEANCFDKIKINIRNFFTWLLYNE
jgi:hypothetical protein